MDQKRKLVVLEEGNIDINSCIYCCFCGLAITI